MTGRVGVVLTLGLTQTLAWASSYYLLAILAGAIGRDLKLAVPWVFAAFSLGLLLSAALGPSVGRVIDRRGGRGVLCLANGGFAAGLSLLAIARGPVGLVLAWLVLGAAMAAGLYDAAFATVTRLYGRTARGAITGITLMAGFASTVGWPLSSLLQAEIGWRGACLAWAALHLVVGLPLNRLLLPARPPAAQPAAAASFPEPGPTAAPRRAMVLLALAFAAVWTVSTGMAAHLPRLLETAGATPGTALAAAALVGPAQVLARLIEFGLLRRLHPLTNACLAATLHPIGALLLVLLGSPAAAAFALLHGAGNGMLTIAKGTLPLALFGAAGYGLRTGRLAMATQTAQAIAPLLFSLALDRTGLGALGLSAGLCLGALSALLLLRSMRRAATAGSPATMPTPARTSRL